MMMCTVCLTVLFLRNDLSVAGGGTEPQVTEVANTGNIQVAVANEDKGTTSTLVGHLDAGQQTVNQLKKNQIGRASCRERV